MKQSTDQQQPEFSRSTSHASIAPSTLRFSRSPSLDGPTAINTPLESPDPFSHGNKSSHVLEKDPYFPFTSRSSTSHSVIHDPILGKCSSQSTDSPATILHDALERHKSKHGTERGKDMFLPTCLNEENGGEEQVIMIDWAPGDPENPQNFSRLKKYLILMAANLATVITASSLSSSAVLATWGTTYWGVSREVFVLGLTLALVAIGIAPLALAPLSESFGRNPIYQVTSVISAVFFIPQIWSKNYGGVLVSRFCQGIGMSVSNSMVGGTVADLFPPSERGVPMSLFTVTIFWSQGIAMCYTGWTAQTFGIQWAYGIQALVAVGSIIFNIFFMRETRGDVLLHRRAMRLTKKTGIRHMATNDLESKDMLALIKVSLVRPMSYLVTEPIVTALSTWIGFAWACIFLGQSSIMLVFEAYGFNAAQAGSFEITMAIGGTLGLISQYHQEHLFRKAAKRNGGKAPPEARLYWAAYGGLLFPISLYVYAWTGRAGVVHWAVPAVALIFMNLGVSAMYSGVFTYLADAYEIYSSSAQAAQSFCRNVLSAVFPLFARQLYVNLGYPQASTLVASVALLLSAAPILLIIYGKDLRARSKVTSQLCRDEVEFKEKDLGK